MDAIIFVENVKRRCNAKGVSASRACTESGAGRALLDNVKRGKIPSIDRVEALAKYLNCTVGELIGEKTSPAGQTGGASEEEQKLLDDFRRLSPELRTAIQRIVAAAAPVPNPEPKEQPVPNNVIRLKARKKHGMVDIKVFDQPAAAGLGNYIDIPPYHIETYPEDIIHPEADFGIIISGDSMEPKVHDGGTAFVEYRPTIEPGQIGIFVLNGQAYCKRLAVDQTDRRVHLVSINPKYEDIIIREHDDFRTVGRVRGQWTRGIPQDDFGW